MTTWADVISRINVVTGPAPAGYSAFSADDALTTWSYLSDLYNYSDTARALLNSLVANDQTLDIAQGNNTTSIMQSGSDRVAGYDLGLTANISYFNDAGLLVPANAHLVLIHEIYHALSGLGDPGGTAVRGMPTLGENAANFDFRGPTVDFQNAVAQEMGMAIESAYGPVLTADGGAGSAQLNFLAPNVSYTFGHQIDFTALPFDDNPTDASAGHTLNYAANDKLAYSTSINQSGVPITASSIATDANGLPISADELLIAFAGANVLASGGGNDFLYGGNNDDFFKAGAGNNFVDGGNYVGSGSGPSSHDYRSDGIDTITYSSGSSDQSATGASVLLDGGASGQAFLGKKTITVVDNGHVGISGADGADQLYSVEHVGWIANLVVSSFDLTSYALTPDSSNQAAMLWASGMVAADGLPLGNVDITAANSDFSLSAFTDTFGGQWDRVFTGNTFTGLAISSFNLLEIRGDNDAVHFGGDLGSTIVEMTGASDIADASAMPSGSAATIILGPTDEVTAGAGALALSSLHPGVYEGSLLLPENWSDYQITHDPDSDTYNLVPSDGTADAYSAHEIAQFQFADVTLDAADLLNRVPTAVPSVSGTYHQGDTSPASGSIAFSDPNVGDAHTASLQLPQGFLGQVSLQDTEQSGSGSIGWQFSASDDSIRYLAAGQTITEVLPVTVTDLHGASSTADLSIQIVGINDPAMFAVGGDAGSVTDLARTATGALHFTDPDTIDTHSISGIQMTSGGANGPMGALTGNIVHDSNGNATGEIDWSYHLNSAPTANVTETWQLSLSDAHSTVTKNVAVNIAPASHPSGDQLPKDVWMNEAVYNGEVSNQNTNWIVGGINEDYANPSGPAPFMWVWKVTDPSSPYETRGYFGANGGTSLAIKLGWAAHNGDVVHLLGTAEGSNGNAISGIPQIAIDFPIVTESQYAYNSYQTTHVVDAHVNLA